jgi:YHS domain-containing protein
MRLLIILFFVFVIYLVVSVLLGFSSLGRPRHRRREQLGGEMVRDPVCETYIPKATAIEKTFNGRPVFFCSPTCAEAYARAGQRPG